MMQKALLNKMARKGLFRNYTEIIQKQKTVEPIVFDKCVTITQMASRIGKSLQMIVTRIKELQKRGVVKRKGPDKGGFWDILQ